MFFPISSWLPAFAVTVAVEAPIVVLAFRPVTDNLVAVAIVLLFANLATHLSIWYLLTQLLVPGSLAFAAAGESWAVVGETMLYWAAIPEISASRAVLTAAVANLASFAAGLVIWSVLPAVTS